MVNSPHKTRFSQHRVRFSRCSVILYLTRAHMSICRYWTVEALQRTTAGSLKEQRTGSIAFLTGHSLSRTTSPVANCSGTMGSLKYSTSENDVRVNDADLVFAQDKEEFTPFVQQNLFGELRPCSPPKSVAQQIVERNALALDDLDTIIFRYERFQLQ